MQQQQQQQVNEPTPAHDCEYDRFDDSEPTTPTWDAAPLNPAPAVALPPVRKPAHQVKLVLVGDSGVGKTSLRQRYLSSSFSTSYKATIGCDYVVKTLSLAAEEDANGSSSAAPGPSAPAPPAAALTTPDVQLAIWDTAGQERYASLSTAFFRGADAVVFVYDVGCRASLTSLERWWAVFRDKCPVRSGDERAFPVVVVGNKADGQGALHADDDEGDRVTEADARELWERLVPPPPVPLSDAPAPTDAASPPAAPDASPSSSSSPPRPSSHSIQISPASPPLPHHNHAHALLAASSASHYQTPSSSFSSALNSALSEHPPLGPPPAPRAPPFASTLAAGGYHLPPAASSSSIYSFKTARSTQTVAFPSSSSSSALAHDGDGGPSELHSDGHRRNRSTSSRLSFASSTSEAPSTSTVRPARRSLLAREAQPPPPPPTSSSSGASSRTPTPSLPPQDAADDRPPSSEAPPPPPPPPEPQAPEPGPTFFASCSAKTGAGVADVFEHVARRVALAREWDERQRERAREWDEAADGRVDVRKGGSSGFKGWCAC